MSNPTPPFLDAYTHRTYLKLPVLNKAQQLTINIFPKNPKRVSLPKKYSISIELFHAHVQCMQNIEGIQESPN